MKLPPVFLGIDPGDKSSASLIDKSGKILETQKFQSSTEVQITDWFKRVRKTYLDSLRCSIEWVMPRPSFGKFKYNVQSQFYLGESFGFFQAILIMLNIDFVKTTPQVWQKAVGMTKRDTANDETTAQFKTRLRDLAHKIWPKSAKLISKQNCDSLLIAEALRRKTK